MQMRNGDAVEFAALSKDEYNYGNEIQNQRPEKRFLVANSSFKPLPYILHRLSFLAYNMRWNLFQRVEETVYYAVLNFSRLVRSVEKEAYN